MYWILEHLLNRVVDASVSRLAALVQRLAERLVDSCRIVQCHARFVPDSRDQVRHVSLVLEHHQRDDVAVRCQVGPGVELRVEVFLVLGPDRFEFVRLALVANEGVASMLLRAMGAGDVPAAPSLFNWLGLGD
jgi:hypothetical protein